MAEPNNIPTEKGIKGKAKMVEKLSVWELLFAGDLKSALRIGIRDVFGPRLRNMMAEFSDTVIRSFIFGDEYKSSYTPDSNKTNYRVISTNNQMLPASQARGGNRYDSITLEFDSYVDAQGTREFIQNFINNYGSCSVLRALSYVDQPTIPNDDYYGWTNIDTANITPRGRGTFILTLPKPMELERGKR